jgi:hypothetical protein
MRAFNSLAVIGFLVFSLLFILRSFCLQVITEDLETFSFTLEKFFTMFVRSVFEDDDLECVITSPKGFFNNARFINPFLLI